MLNAFKSYWQKLQVPGNALVLATVSGGVDSMVMLHLMLKCNLKVAVLHCNFNLRGADSVADENFVKQTATAYGLPCFIKNFSKSDFEVQTGSTQMKARTLRYAWFEDMRLQLNAIAFATAHHQTDVTETILINQLRGTGLAGMHGILQQKNCIRPMLFTDAATIRAYATENHITWRHDVSNDNDTYIRNKIRHQIIPVLKCINPIVEQTFVQNARHFHAAEIILETFLPQLKAQFLIRGQMVDMPIKPLMQHAAGNALLFYLLNDYGFNNTDLENLWLAMTKGETGKKIYSKSHVALVNRDAVCIKKLEEMPCYPFVINQAITFCNQTTTITFENINNFSFEQLNHSDVYTACFDASKISFPINFRNWQAGDFFFPLGMKGKKKLSDFFIDLKISQFEKSKVPLLIVNNQIAWVVGYRLDERFKVTPQTKSVIKIKWQFV
ncbi:MAG: tRNA lysidine(34) synthetase TilS [Bacteroidia bacterium]|nr:tRNA lysidine(34) synthetase TilS [Bacteroidia bacterium]